ncbi:ABC transporter substrate-binding protein [Microbacterium sp. Marseille-Q6965]|uniref:ABC transporter substrate-binding protein n=1 Tax=Microbacterium sp. Marseille-Q6965 TaxID=2965072 RepID=UPI0021B754E9|nr:ABC transporter substrate-binding protein [Microbacterium sp. Marseille-Q6965]
MNTTSRALSVIAAGAAALLALTGCSSAVSGGEGEAAERDTLRIGLSGGVNTLDPHNTASVGSDLSVIGSIYSALVHRTPDGEMVPDAAESWEQVDALTWTFELDPDVTFSNGDPLTADDVVWNFERVQDPDLALRLQSFFTNVEEVTAEGDTTVSIRTAQPDADLLQSLSFFYLLDPDWAQENDPSGAAMGSGPYTLTDYTPKGALTLEAREDYWADAAQIATIEYADLGSSEAEVNALQTGEIDLVSGLSPKDMARFEGDQSVVLEALESSRAAFVKLNTRLDPVSDVRVRQALNYAVDKQAIIEAILRGTVEPSRGQILTENFTGFDPDLEPYPYDPERARELLAEAGYADGLEIALEYPTDQYVEAEAIVQAVAAQLAEVGVTVDISSAPFDVWLSKYVQEGDMAQSIYITQSWQTTSGFLGLFEQSSPYAYWDDDEYTRLLTDARFAATPEEQSAAYSETLAYFREQAPVLFLFPQPAIYGMDAALEWTPSPDGWILPYDMSFTE